MLDLSFFFNWFSGNGLIYQATQVGAPQESDGSHAEDPPAVRSPKRVKLSDGRHLAYMERGVPKANSNCKIIIVHGFGSSKEMNFRVPQVLAFNSLLTYEYLDNLSVGLGHQ